MSYQSDQGHPMLHEYHLSPEGRLAILLAGVGRLEAVFVSNLNDPLTGHQRLQVPELAALGHYFFDRNGMLLGVERLETLGYPYRMYFVAGNSREYPKNPSTWDRGTYDYTFSQQERVINTITRNIDNPFAIPLNQSLDNFQTMSQFAWNNEPTNQHQDCPWATFESGINLPDWRRMYIEESPAFLEPQVFVPAPVVQGPPFQPSLYTGHQGTPPHTTKEHENLPAPVYGSAVTRTPTHAFSATNMATHAYNAYTTTNPFAPYSATAHSLHQAYHTMQPRPSRHQEHPALRNVYQHIILQDSPDSHNAYDISNNERFSIQDLFGLSFPRRTASAMGGDDLDDGARALMPPVGSGRGHARMKSRSMSDLREG